MKGTRHLLLVVAWWMVLQGVSAIQIQGQSNVACAADVIIQPGDTEADIILHLGQSPLVEPIDGARFGTPGFHPHWAWLSDHGGWFEMILTYGSTFANVLFIEDAEGVEPELLAMCRCHAGDSA